MPDVEKAIEESARLLGIDHSPKEKRYSLKSGSIMILEYVPFILR